MLTIISYRLEYPNHDHQLNFASLYSPYNKESTFSSLFVYFTASIDSPPPMLKKPPINTAFNLEKLARVTKKGAPMLPILLIASETPKPVERMAVGKV